MGLVRRLASELIAGGVASTSEEALEAGVVIARQDTLHHLGGNRSWAGRSAQHLDPTSPITRHHDPRIQQETPFPSGSWPRV